MKLYIFIPLMCAVEAATGQQPPSAGLKHSLKSPPDQAMVTREVQLSRAQRLTEEGHFEEARRRLIDILDEREKAGPLDVLSSIALNDLGTVDHALGRYAEAEKSFLRGIRLLDGLGQNTHPVMSRLLDNLASLYMDFGDRYRQVERLRKRALELRIAEVGPEGDGIPTLLSNLGTVYMKLRRFEEAAGHFRRALQILERLGCHDDVRIAGIHHNLAILAATMRDNSEVRVLRKGTGHA